MMKRVRNFIFLILAVVTFVLPGVWAASYNHVISNSENWRDVYSVIHFGNLNGVTSDFLVSTKHGPLLLNDIPKTDSLLILTSKEKPFIFNYQTLAESRGFSDAEERIVDEANLELINELPDVRKFIIVGPTYGYNAIAVAPYAVVSKSWVFFADRTNIADIESILSRRQVDEIIIYGYVDREVKQALSSYNPTIINTGDRFKDNVEIVEKYLEIKPVKQVVLTNGEFIERQVMAGFEPVLFTGKENVPTQISDYLKSSDIEVGVLVGGDLVGAATNIRRTTGISVIVKFARGARAPTGAIAAVEGLDLYFLPVPSLNLEISSVRYNKALNQLEVTYRSTSNAPVYFKGTVNVKSDAGESVTVGDTDAVFIAPNDYKTVTYPDFRITGGNLTAKVTSLYGETQTALEKTLEKTLSVDIVTVIDKCEIDVEKVKYNPGKGRFAVVIRNTGAVTCWVDAELKDVLVDNVKTTFGSDGSLELGPGGKGSVYISGSLSDGDIDANSFVNVNAYYGERQDSLVKVLQGKYPLVIERFSYVTVTLVIVAAAIIIMILILLLWKRKKRGDDEL